MYTPLNYYNAYNRFSLLYEIIVTFFTIHYCNVISKKIEDTSRGKKVIDVLWL